MELRTVVLDTADLVDQACALYRDVLGAPGMQLNPRLLVALVRNGGTAVGLVDDERLVAFAYGVHARDSGGDYHYSQSAAVARDFQGQGLGRRLKHAQAELVRSAGTGTMRWAYDPTVGRNAHFNLDVLGARARWFVEDFYLVPNSDRVVVEWDLHGPEQPGPVVEELVVSDAASARAGFHRLLASGLEGVTCRRGDEGTSVYGFAERKV